MGAKSAHAFGAGFVENSYILEHTRLGVAWEIVLGGHQTHGRAIAQESAGGFTATKATLVSRLQVSRSRRLGLESFDFRNKLNES